MMAVSIDFSRSAWLIPTMEKRLPDPKEVAKYKNLMLNTLDQVNNILRLVVSKQPQEVFHQFAVQ